VGRNGNFAKRGEGDSRGTVTFSLEKGKEVRKGRKREPLPNHWGEKEVRGGVNLISRKGEGEKFGGKTGLQNGVVVCVGGG